jgi:CheY-like chemotaxis protein
MSPRSDTKSRSTRPDSPLDGVRVLLVEDDAMVREVMKRLLVGFGALVTAVAGVRDALEALPRARPNVLVSDIDMPGEDGYALIRKIRALPTDRGGQTPAIGLTGWSPVEIGVHVLRAGFQYCLAKPVDARRLVTVVAALAASPARRSTGAALMSRARTTLGGLTGPRKRSGQRGENPTWA